MEGWIKLHRKFINWEWFQEPHMVHLFIYLLLKANHEDGRWRGMDIKRGQLITGLHSLHFETKISIRSLRTCLSRLEQTGEIDKQSDNQYSVITIIKYDDYQDIDTSADKQSDKRPTSDRQATDKRPTTNKNEKNNKNEKKYSNIPPTFEEVKNRIEERNISSFTAELFYANYEKNGWLVGKNKMKNWDAALTYWNKNNFNNKTNANTGKSNQRSGERERTNEYWNN